MPDVSKLDRIALDDINKVDYDLFDALSRRITLKFMQYSEKALSIW